MKHIVLRLHEEALKKPDLALCTHSIILDRGTLEYGTQTYDPLTTYLKCLHLTIDGWLPDRDNDGWKVATSRFKSVKVTKADFILKSASYVATVNPEKRLLSDLKAVVELTSRKNSPSC